jgi:hypothetical protein
MSVIGQTVVWIILLLALYVVRRLIFSKYFRVPLPPGPSGWPIVGNLFDLPSRHLWEKLADWAPIYGMALVSKFLPGY